MSLPHDMMFDGSPTPRNERVASATMAAAREIVVTTMTGAIEFGRMCRSRMRKRETPSAVDAVTKSEFFTLKISARSTRAVAGQAKTPIASEMTHTFRYATSTDMMTTAARMYGI